MTRSRKLACRYCLDFVSSTNWIRISVDWLNSCVSARPNFCRGSNRYKNSMAAFWPSRGRVGHCSNVFGILASGSLVGRLHCELLLKRLQILDEIALLFIVKPKIEDRMDLVKNIKNMRCDRGAALTDGTRSRPPRELQRRTHYRAGFSHRPLSARRTRPCHQNHRHSSVRAQKTGQNARF
jgi:hypothetical protein